MDPILLASLQQAEGLSHLHDGVQDLDQVLLHAVAAVVDGVAVVAVVVASCIEAAAEIFETNHYEPFEISMDFTLLVYLCILQV